jgi:hypothetical protein
MTPEVEPARKTRRENPSSVCLTSSVDQTSNIAVPHPEMGDQTSDEATLRRLRQMVTYQQFRCSQKFAIDDILAGNDIYLMHNSGSPLWWLNVVLIDEFLDNHRDDPLQLIAGFHTFFESSKMFEFVPWMILTSNPDVFVSRTFPSKNRATLI